jgi:transposase
MAYREVSVVEIREVLRRWLLGQGYRAMARDGVADRKTVRSYVKLAKKLGLDRGGGAEQLDDGFIGAMAAELQPGRVGGRGESWRVCEQQREFIRRKLEKDKLRLTKVHTLLTRRVGPKVPYRTLNRFAHEELGFGRRRGTMRVDDCEPGRELQMDFGFMGLLDDAEQGRRRKVWALIFTAVYSRHTFVWLTYRQRFEDIVEGCERAWEFFGGVYHVLVPDNVKAIVAQADPINPRFTEGFIEYSQARDLLLDPARIRRPKDKPRVERTVIYVRESFFQGEDFRSMDEANAAAGHWCLETAGKRTHGTTCRRPLEVFEAEARPRLNDAPDRPYDVPMFADPKVHDDQHFIVDKALYSAPEQYVGKQLHVRADRCLVRAYYRRQLVKTHPRKPPGGRSTDREDFAEEKIVYAERDSARLVAQAEGAGESVGEYARRLVDTPALWRQMRALYRLLGLVRRFGATPVEQACGRALELDVVDVTRIERMVKGGLESSPHPAPPVVPPWSGAGNVIELRFARPAEHFAVTGNRGGCDEPR